MRRVLIENIRKLRKAIPKIENKIKIRINLVKGGAVIKGEELNEFIVEKILFAIDFGFDTEEALLLRDQNFVLEFIDIKKYTRRKNLKDVRARIIGKKGKARKKIEELTGGSIAIKGNKIGLIVDSTHLDSATNAIISLIQGSKHGNVFSYLEKQNKNLKKFDMSDLGLR